MDKQSNSTTVPEISTLIMGTDRPEIRHRLSVEEVQKLSMKELRALMAMFVTVSEVALGLLNQERFAGKTYGYNAAGQIGDGLLDHFNDCIAMVEQVAKDARPRTAEDAEDRAWLLIQRAAEYSEDLPRFVAASAQLSVTVLDLEGAR
ncbi:hypothetical protein [Shinella zoogloeoides]|uniref:hypothetical protein n=1 Tax=Shinella zoogloeoides TaxID=352475 RepID=UPI00273E10D7|nr:hypothetical protein [Shinella zoogloeoides]WLR94217.1 hypothetical protein Q9316_08630 [Shinella zoogloeoides]